MCILYDVTYVSLVNQHPLTFDTKDYKNIEGGDYRFFLEYATKLETAESTTLKTSTFSLAGFSVFDDIKDKIVVMDLNVTGDGPYQGHILKPTIADDNSTLVKGTSFDGIAVGYVYDMSIVLPQFYITKTINQNATESLDTANFIVHRVKMNLGQIGYYETTLKLS